LRGHRTAADNRERQQQNEAATHTMTHLMSPQLPDYQIIRFPNSRIACQG
jgi:hypothetical protein